MTGEIPPELGGLSNLDGAGTLRDNQLTGEIPPELGGLSNLTGCLSDDNQLTGEIPPELGGLSNLQRLYLSDNRLTGCVPPRLRDVPDNDLDQLGLPFCPLSPPEASTISSVTSEMDSITISWATPLSDGGSDITAYDLRHIETDDDETVDPNWTVVEDIWTTGSGALEYTLTGLTADTQYDIQVRAENEVGDGPWSVTNTATTVSASACVAGGAVSDTVNTGLVSDCEALLSAHDTLARTGSLNWSADTPIARWDGLGVGGSPQRVTRLNLAGKGLGGTIPASLGELTMLADLNLRTNALSGPIPAELGGLTNLVRLNLHTNQLTGPVPDLSRMSNLEEMYLARNMLTGAVPAWLNGMTNMRELWLWGNELSGTIPDLSGMTSLEKLKLAANDLEGGVPEASALPANLRWLIIQENPLGGTIPDLSGMSRLTVLWLHTNGLTGEVPASHLPSSLTSLNLHSNQFSGEIPDLSGLDRLQWLRLQNNQLSGAIPSTLGDMDSLTRLWLHENMLSGPIPAWLGGLTKLQRLWLSDNMLSGEIPEELGDLATHSLVQWRLSGNRLTGCVPAGLAAIADNDFDGLGLDVCSGSQTVEEVFDRLIPGLIKDWDIPGASLAVAKDGRLVLAKGYGLANVENQDPVQPDTLFRIASISKPITAVAVLQLVGDGFLELDDRVFQILQRFQPPEGADRDPRLDDITVRHLLQHSGGWDQGRSYDPMWNTGIVEEELGVSKPVSCPDVIRFMLGQPLDFDPGTEYAYSNFGYCLLGRVIEERTGQPYEQYVKERVLAPIGVSRMHIGGTLPEDRADREATYYGFPGQELAYSAVPNTPQRVPWPDGGFHLKTMDAHGGWVASAIDLVRFATSVDGSKPPPVIGPQTVQMMVARPAPPLWQGSSYYYGMGWLVSPVGDDANWWHDGSLPGTYALLVRTHDGFAWAVLFNSRPEEWSKFGLEVDRLIWRGIGEVNVWPSWAVLFTTCFPNMVSTANLPGRVRTTAELVRACWQSATMGQKDSREIRGRIEVW